ncbi:MAG: tRNA epoxyqueuosine(34) reductase QueG [Candidatus Aenigmarchaeota archaeon]|nr:tRNA epoxyqueuosine(34) reductase QueG [Candidatus Aenigmarchaeota archaeon]
MKEYIRTIAAELGFDVVGFCTPEIDDNIKEAYESWVASGMNAGMDFMAKNAEIRADLNKLLPDVQSVIVVALSYLKNSQSVVPQNGKGIVARYAQSRDYHKIFKKKLIELAEKTEDFLGETVVACDTKPILERYFAWKAGVGFVGKNSLLITWKHGSFVLLGTVLTTAKISPDKPDSRGCGTCTKCIDACPTKAIVADKRIDARKCIAYWTIEHKGKFNEQTVPLHNRLFGCDICQEVCPWNQKALLATYKEFKEERVPPLLELKNIIEMKKEAFVQKFAGTPIMRAGFEGLKRNAERILEEQQTSMP